MDNNLENKNIPKCPSVLILTDPQADLKGRFGEGKHLGWMQQKNEFQDRIAKNIAQKAEKQERDKARLKAKQLGKFGEDEEDGEPKNDWNETEQPTQRTVIAVPLSSDRALAQLREQAVSTITPISEIKEIISSYSQRFGIPIVITTDMGSNRYADAVSYKESGRIKIHLHPILQYRDRAYIESAILREIEDCRDFEKQRAFGWQRG